MENNSIPIGQLKCTKIMNGTQEMWRLEGNVQILFPQLSVFPDRLFIEGETKTMSFVRQRTFTELDHVRNKELEVSTYVPDAYVLDARGKKSSVLLRLINELEIAGADVLARLKKNEDVQEYVINWAKNKKKADGSREFDAPYGVLSGTHINGKGNKYWGVTFGRARTLDITVEIYNPKFMLVKNNAIRSSVVCRNPMDLMAELEKL